MLFSLSIQTKYLIQGITGKEGRRAATWMQLGGAQVLAGVSPGHGGEVVEGVPVYDSVAEALQAHPDTTVSSIYVPPKFVKVAATEAVKAGISLIHIIAEQVPTRDSVDLLELVKQKNARMLGPSSVGVVTTGTALGSLGGGVFENFLFPKANSPGVALISKSGGMANTVASLLTAAQIPQTIVAGIGGDRVIGTTFADVLPELEADVQTKALVIIGEIGGSAEEDLATALKSRHFTKPVIAYISGIFAETLPKGIAFGHAGAIVDAQFGTRKSKIDALSAVGVHLAQNPEEIVKQLKKVVQL